MSAPPGLMADTPAPLEARQGEDAKANHLSVQTLTREARKVMDDWGMSLSQNRLQRIIRRFIREGRADVDFRTWFIAYADPTGETAVRNVMRAGR